MLKAALLQTGRSNQSHLILAALVLALAIQPLHAGRAFPGAGDQRKAIVMGAGDPKHDPFSHPMGAQRTFLRFVGNPNNKPGKGWTCEFEWDLKVRFGMNPTNTPAEALFNYIGQHHLGYRIAMNCGPNGHSAAYWRCAVDNGIMPFGPHYNNMYVRIDDPNGIGVAVSVAGGAKANVTSYGPGLEFIDAVLGWGPNPDPNGEDAAQSWANQRLAARFARVLDTHPAFNIWDAREFMRQAASFWDKGWTEVNGYGRVNENAFVGTLLPGPPVDFHAVRSHDQHQVVFAWHNFAQTDFAATVIARHDGRIIYDGTGTNFAWPSDVNGSETFTYWSRNRAGEKSRMESYQTRTVTGLSCGPYRTCLVVSAPSGTEGPPFGLAGRFQEVATNWVADVVSRTGYCDYDPLTHLPRGPIVALLPDLPAMIGYAISNHYRILVAPIAAPDRDLYAYKPDWDRATAAGILVVLPHHGVLSLSRIPKARRLSPPCLFSAVTVGAAMGTNCLSFGPGIEFFDAPEPGGSAPTGFTPGADAAAVVAGKLARILDAYPRYNLWDARQHLRQSASHYAAGWSEDGGYGRPPPQPASIAELDPAPPLALSAAPSDQGRSVTLSWQNFLQSSFAETVIQRSDGRTIYHGTGTNYTWPSDVEGQETFRFFSRDKSGRLSRPEAYTVLTVAGLHRAQ